MAVLLNHTIVAAKDGEAAASWFAALFGIGEPRHRGPFWEVVTDNAVSLDFESRGDDPFTAQHYAFLVGEDDFDATYGRIVERGVDHWADPHQHRAGAINHHDGGRGVYFANPDGHLLEIITRPYGIGD